MTVGADLILSVVKSKSRAALFEINPELLVLDDEQNLYQYVRDYLDDHGQFPTLRTLRRHASVVVDRLPREPSSHFTEQARNRAMYQAIRPIFSDMSDTLQGGQTDMSSLSDQIETMHQIKQRFRDHGSGIDDSVTILDNVRNELATVLSNHGLRGVTSGYNELDLITNGYQSDDLVIWVGRPGRGKSWLLLYQMFQAWRSGSKVLYVSNEMSGLASMRRVVGMYSRVNPDLIKKGHIQTNSIEYIERCIEEMQDFTPLHMVTANFDRTVGQVRAFIERYEPDIVYIDAAYLLSPTKKRYGSSGRRETISDVIEELKQLSANCARPIICTVQFNRVAEQRRRGVSDVTVPMDGGPPMFNPIGHLSLDVIGETDVISQAASHIIGIELAPSPYQKSMRAFGFLKGREGEDGNWWYCNYPEFQYSPIDLSLVSFGDPRVLEINEAMSRRASGNAPVPRRGRSNIQQYMNSEGAQ